MNDHDFNLKFSTYDRFHNASAQQINPWPQDFKSSQEALHRYGDSSCPSEQISQQNFLLLVWPPVIELQN